MPERNWLMATSPPRCGESESLMRENGFGPDILGGLDGAACAAVASKTKSAGRIRRPRSLHTCTVNIPTAVTLAILTRPSARKERLRRADRARLGARRPRD